MGDSPLEDPLLQAVEAALDAGRLADAHAMLSELDDAPEHRRAISYLTTRLLFQRGKLSAGEVAARMDQVLRTLPDFPEARALLDAARRGTLAPPPPSSAGRSALPQAGSQIPAPEPRPAVQDAQPALPSPSLAPAAATFVTRVSVGSGSHPLTSDTVPAFEIDPEATPIVPVLPGELHMRAEIEAARFEIESTSYSGGTGSVASAEERETIDESAHYIDTPVADYLPKSPDPETDEEEMSLGFSSVETPSLFQILSLLDAHRYTEALAALGANRNRDAPELTLMRARALLGAGQREEARDAVEQLCLSEIGPELRAGCARLLIDAGEVELALEQAEVACGVAPDSPAVLLTTAWATLRMARRDEDESKLGTVEELLGRLGSSGGASPALATALWACVWAERGEAQRAVEAANHALELDPGSVDAMVALTIASAELGLREDSADTWRRLLAKNQEEALGLRPKLARLGAEMQRVSPSLAPSAAEPVSRRTWDPLEVALVSGEHDALLDAWESICEQALAAHERHETAALSRLGLEAAGLLSVAPAFRHFGPYDLSLWSVLRLQVALDLVCGQHAWGGRDLAASALALGTYVGESIRHAYAGTWRGTLAEPLEARVEVNASSIQPLAQTRARLLEGVPLSLDDMLPLEAASRALPQWQRRVDEASAPPNPWGPTTWPTLQDAGALGRALSRSVVGMYSEAFAERSLDHTLGSLRGLDSYLTLLAPARAPKLPDSPALKRAAVLVGAYTGEVLRTLCEGVWLSGDGTGGAAYALGFDNVRIWPIQHALDRVLGNTTETLSEYAQRQATLLVGG